MYSENRRRDALLVCRAAATNLVARFAPATYVRLTGQTGRGAGESEDDVVSYFIECFADYCHHLAEGSRAFRWDGLRVLEYGPGDILGTALLFYAHGAEQVECVDRFPLQSSTERSARILGKLIDRLPAELQARARSAFRSPGEPHSGFRPECVAYVVSPDGLSGRSEHYDIVLSRAVLEHVNDLEATMRDIERSLRPGGVSVHNVDLRSHNLDRDRPLDFLTWPDWAYRLMYSHKGFPNRWRAGNYREMLRHVRLRVTKMEPTARMSAEDLARVRTCIAPHLLGTSDELTWLGFWLRLDKVAAW